MTQEFFTLPWGSISGDFRMMIPSSVVSGSRGHDTAGATSGPTASHNTSKRATVLQLSCRLWPSRNLSHIVAPTCKHLAFQAQLTQHAFGMTPARFYQHFILPTFSQISNRNQASDSHTYYFCFHWCIKMHVVKQTKKSHWHGSSRFTTTQSCTVVKLLKAN